MANFKVKIGLANQTSNEGHCQKMQLSSLYLQIITVILFMQELFYVKIALTRTSMSGSFGSTQAKGPRDQSLNPAWSKLYFRN